MIYVLQLDRPLGNPNNPRGQASFYVGYCEDDRLYDRINEHRAGRGAKMLRAATRKGITFGVVMTIPQATRDDERKFKNKKNTPKLVAQYRERCMGIPF